MTKENVTLENIKQDLLSQIREDLLARLQTIALIWLILTGVGCIFLICGREYPFGIITIISFVAFIIILLRGILQIDKAKQGKFIVKRDILTDKYGIASEFPSRNGLPLLFFSQGNSSPITRALYYKWSEFPRSGKTVFDLTDIGDSFILVKLNKRVWVVYNERFFTAPWL